MANLDIGLKENLSWFTILSLMSKILGWNLYLLKAFLIRSEIFVESGLIRKEFPLKSKVETASLKKLFSSSGTSLSSCSNLSPSASFILPWWLPLFAKKGFIVYQINLLSDTKEVFSLLKKFFFSFFVDSAAVVFCFL